MADLFNRYVLTERVIARSVLDRLLDAEPDRLVDPPSGIATQITELRETLRRDLEALLNTRRSPVSPPKNLIELADSALTYGVDGFVSTNLVTDAAKIAFSRELQLRITRAETRLEDVCVTVLEKSATSERVLKMRIDAVLRIQNGKSPIKFDTVLDPSSQRFMIEAAHE